MGATGDEGAWLVVSKVKLVVGVEFAPVVLDGIVGTTVVAVVATFDAFSSFLPPAPSPRPTRNTTSPAISACQTFTLNWRLTQLPFEPPDGAGFGGYHFPSDACHHSGPREVSLTVADSTDTWAAPPSDGHR